MIFHVLGKWDCDFPSHDDKRESQDRNLMKSSARQTSCLQSNGKLTWSRKAYRLRRSVIQFGFRDQVCSAYHPKVSFIHPPTGPPIPAPSPNILPRFVKRPENGRCNRSYMFAMPWYNPRCFLDRGLACRIPASGGKHTMVSSL